MTQHEHKYDLTMVDALHGFILLLREMDLVDDEVFIKDWRRSRLDGGMVCRNYGSVQSVAGEILW